MVEGVPENQVICVFHTHVANQIPQEGNVHFLLTIEEIGRRGDIFHISNNIQDYFLHVDYYVNGVERKNIIADTDGHGRWFEWLFSENRL